MYYISINRKYKALANFQINHKLFKKFLQKVTYKKLIIKQSLAKLLHQNF